MEKQEAFRYFWIKATDGAGREQASAAALDLVQDLAACTLRATSGSDEALTLRIQRNMARWYLTGEIPRGTKTMLVTPRIGHTLTADVILLDADAPNDMEISIASMPIGYTEDLSRDWINSPVGKAWSHGALRCRLAHAAVTVHSELAQLGSSLETSAY